MSAFKPYKPSISIRASLGLQNTYLRINEHKLLDIVETLMSRQSDLLDENEQLRTLIHAYRVLLSDARQVRDERDDMRDLIETYQSLMNVHGVRLCPADSADTVVESCHESSSSTTTGET
jgi:hypothetical protein